MDAESLPNCFVLLKAYYRYGLWKAMVLKAVVSNIVGMVCFLKKVLSKSKVLQVLITWSNSLCLLQAFIVFLFPHCVFAAASFAPVLVCVQAMVDNKLSSQWPTKDTTQA